MNAMNPGDAAVLASLLQARQPQGWGGLFHGVYPALVTDIQDPDNQGRVKVSLPWLPDTGGATCELWARLATLMGGNNRGCWWPSRPVSCAAPTSSAPCGMAATHRRRPWTAAARTTRRCCARAMACR